MNKHVGGLVARRGDERLVAGTAVASFLAIPPQQEPHGPVQAPLAGMTSAGRDHACEIADVFPGQFM